MGTEFGSLSIALSALQSERKALSVTGQNIANANTPGYTRQRADLQDSPEAYKKDVETADNWVQKALETKRKKAEAAAKGPGGIVMDKNTK